MQVRTLLNPVSSGPVAMQPFGPPTAEPLAFHRLLPGYAPSPLRRVPSLAGELGVREVLVKDESSRLGLPSYKILGASWATCREVQDRLGVAIGTGGLRALRTDLEAFGPRALAAATDGNHGRAVARVARWLGWQARIFVPEGTAAARLQGIREEGATVTVVQGSYDDAVERSAREADDRTLVISDTSWAGYEVVPRRVVEGYSTIFWEVEDELAALGLAPPTCVVAQMGVGSLAAAAVLHYRCRGLPDPPALVGVEPADAACVLASVAAGGPVEVSGPHRSAMAGLNCGVPSPLALPLLAAGMGTFLAVDDQAAEAATRLLAAAGIEAGESGAAGLAGLLASRRSTDVATRGATGLTVDSVVLLLNTEGVTDPVNYARIINDLVTQG